MTDAVIGELLKLGLPGAVIIGLGWALVRVHNLWVESQNKRLSDSQAMTERVLTLINTHNEMNKANLEVQKSTRELVEAALTKGSRK